MCVRVEGRRREMDAFHKSQERGSAALRRERAMRDAGATTPRTLSTHGVFSELSYTGVGRGMDDPSPYDPIGMHREQFMQEALRKGIAVPFVERTHVRATVDPGAGPFLSMPTCSKGASFDRKTFFRCAIGSLTLPSVAVTRVSRHDPRPLRARAPRMRVSVYVPTSVRARARACASVCVCTYVCARVCVAATFQLDMTKA